MKGRWEDQVPRWKTGCTRSLLALGLLLVAFAPRAQSLEKWGYPDVDEFTRATLTLCTDQRNSVILATRYRQAGRSREEVLALVPPNSPQLKLRVVDVYRENIEDVYAFPELGVYSMVAFRAEACRREVMSARRLGRLESVREKISSCENQHGKDQSNALYACVREVVDGMQ